MSKYIYDFTETEQADPLINMQINNILQNVVTQIGPQVSMEPGKYVFALKYGVGQVERSEQGVKQRWLAIESVVATNQNTGMGYEFGFPTEGSQLVFPVTVDQ